MASSSNVAARVAAFAVLLAVSSVASARAQGLGAPTGGPPAPPPVADPPAPPPTDPPPTDPPPIVSASPPAVVASSSRRPDRPYRFGVALEAGYGWTADSDQLYGNGLGRVLVISFLGVEVRTVETYDLEDRSGMYDVDDGHGRMGMTSVGYRLYRPLGRGSLRPLLGLAWIRRSSLRADPDEIFTDYQLTSQHGLALMLGGGVGVRVGPLDLAVDLRLYPTRWSSINGNRVVVRDGMPTTEDLTESPGGIPATLTLSIAIGR